MSEPANQNPETQEETGKKKKSFELIERVFNKAIADGFKPFNGGTPDIAAGSALKETARRFDFDDPQKIQHLLEEGKIQQDASLYNIKAPHEKLILSLRQAGIEVAADDKARRNLLRLQQENKKLQTILKTIDRDNLSVEEVREKIYGLSATPVQVPNWLCESKLKVGSPGIPITIWSDWHYGEKVNLAEMSFRNEYSVKIADSRIRRLVEREIDIGFRHQSNPDYPGIVICLGGDMFTGDGLHAELADTDEVKIIEGFMLLQGRMIWALERMADAYGQVFVPTAFGNHDRNSEKPRFKHRAETSYAYLFYNQLERHFANNPKYRDKVKFLITPESGVHFTVGDHRYYLTHGDMMGVSGGNAIIGSIGPIKRGSMKVAESEASIGKPFDTILMGHWHQHIHLNGIIVNGSLKGWDEYSRLKMRAPYDAPSQAFWFNHSEYGPATVTKVVLDKFIADPKAKANRTIVIFPGRPGSTSQAKPADLKAA